MRVAFLPTCVVDAVAPQVGIAAVRVLRRLGMEVVVPAAATCCGQPAWNSGFAEEAAAVARTTLKALRDEPADVVCVPAGSCAAMIRVFWKELFHVVGDHESAHAAEAVAARTFEFSELLAKGAPATGRRDGVVAYHHSCHMLRELKLHDEPLVALAALDGCETATWTAEERCCGFGGLFSVKQPEISVAMADDKIASLLESGASTLVGCDQSCLMHLQGRLERGRSTIAVKHLAEVLDEAVFTTGGEESPPR